MVAFAPLIHTLPLPSLFTPPILAQLKLNACGAAAIDVNGARTSANIINLVIFNLFIIKFREKINRINLKVI